jgi:hypothetical protein
MAKYNEFGDLQILKASSEELLFSAFCVFLINSVFKKFRLNYLILFNNVNHELQWKYTNRRSNFPVKNSAYVYKTNPIGHCSQEADSHAASQDILAFMEPEVSLPCSQEPATGSCPEPLSLVQACTVYSFKIHFNIISPIYVWFSQVLFLSGFPAKICHFLPPTHACYMPLPSHFP